MKVLVAGVAGFIGSHLCERLLGLENQVICMDNLTTGRISHMEGMLTHPDSHF